MHSLGRSEILKGVRGCVRRPRYKAGDIEPPNSDESSLPKEAVSPPLMEEAFPTPVEAASPFPFEGINPTLVDETIMVSPKAVAM